jgi:hypothetical protein
MKRDYNDLWLNSFMRILCEGKIFRSRFELSRPLLLHIVDVLGEWSLPISLEGKMFVVSQDSHMEKCSASICMLMHACASLSWFMTII